VRDVADRNVFWITRAKDAHPHAAGDFAVKLRDAVAVLAEAQSEDRHAEFLAPVERILATEPQQFRLGNSEGFCIVGDVLEGEFRFEAIVTRGNRSMSGKDAGIANAPLCFAKWQSALAQPRDALECSEGGVTFIH